MSEFETVYGAWHVHVREDYANVAAVLEYPYCLVGVCSFNGPLRRLSQCSEMSAIGLPAQPVDATLSLRGQRSIIG